MAIEVLTPASGAPILVEIGGLLGPPGPVGPSGLSRPLREFPNRAAAEAVVSQGDAWWDTTLEKVRVKITSDLS